MKTAQDAQAWAYKPLGGFIILVSDSAVEQTGLTPGAIYEFQAHGGTALCRWDTTDAAAADGSFTFTVVPGSGPVYVQCPVGNTLLNVIEANAGSAASATLTVQEVQPQ